MHANVVVLVVAIVLATVFGLWLRRYNGHFRGAAMAEVPIGAPASAGQDRSVDLTPSAGGADPDPVVREAGSGAQHAGTGPDLPTAAQIVLSADELSASLGERATLLQFSSAFCAPCRATRRVLADVATMVPGVAHIELDAESHLELVRRLGVMRTPTTFVLDPDGLIVSRASGAPGKAAALAALGHVIP